MVNNTPHPKSYLPPYVEGEDRKIVVAQPLYDLALIIKSASVVKNIYTVTEKSADDILNLAWDTDDVSDLIQNLVPANYKDSEWCLVRGGKYNPCDSYVTNYYYYCHNNNRHVTREIYLKLYLSANFDLVLIVSCHP